MLLIGNCILGLQVFMQWKAKIWCRNCQNQSPNLAWYAVLLSAMFLTLLVFCLYLCLFCIVNVWYFDNGTTWSPWLTDIWQNTLQSHCVVAGDWPAIAGSHSLSLEKLWKIDFRLLWRLGSTQVFPVSYLRLEVIDSVVVSMPYCQSRGWGPNPHQGRYLVRDFCAL